MPTNPLKLRIPPEGRFACPACHEVWDGANLTWCYRRHQWVCGNILCMCNVYPETTEAASEPAQGENPPPDSRHERRTQWNSPGRLR